MDIYVLFVIYIPLYVFILIFYYCLLHYTFNRDFWLSLALPSSVLVFGCFFFFFGSSECNIYFAIHLHSVFVNFALAYCPLSRHLSHVFVVNLFHLQYFRFLLLALRLREAKRPNMLKRWELMEPEQCNSDEEVEKIR